MKKVLILVRNKNNYFWNFIEEQENIDVYNTYKKEFSNSIVKKWRKKNPKRNYFYFGILGTWTRYINEYEKVIIIDSGYTKQMDWVLEKYQGQVFFFYWNKLHRLDDIAKIQINTINKKAIIYSYSRYDCKNFKLFFNSTMYYPKKIEKKLIKYNAIFVGCILDNRAKELDCILEKINSFCEINFIHAVKSEKNMDESYEIKNFQLQDSYISYNQYLEKVFQSKVIIDIDKYENAGLSLRAMESIFYKKKYLTTNKEIKREPFYSKNNVFIFGEDEIENIRNFFDTPYVEIPSDVVEYYRLNNWIKRFV